MFSNFRLATPEEIETIKDHADLGQGCTVLAWDNGDKGADLVVLRTAIEADPLFWSEGTSASRKLVFLAILENLLKFQFGASAYYFNVHESDSEWRSILEKLGAHPTSTAPEFRYKKPIQ